MPKYCIDTSGLMNPFVSIPDDVHASLWVAVKKMLDSGDGAVTKEIFDEMVSFNNDIGKHVGNCKDAVLFEVGVGQWDWPSYIAHNVRMQTAHAQWIAEYINNPNSICLNDLTIIALAKTLNVPVLSMEYRAPDTPECKRRKIPNICDKEGIKHLDFTAFCRGEKYKF